MGGALGAWNAALTGKSPQEAEKPFGAGMEKFTYQPRTEQGKEDTEVVNKALMELMPLAGHTGGFSIPLKVPKEIKPKPVAEPQIIPNPKESLNKSALKLVEKNLDRVKEKEQEIQQSLVDGTASPELQKEAEFLYQQRLKLESDLEHLQLINGIPKEETTLSKLPLEEKQKKYNDLKDLANSGVKLSDKQIELFDNLGMELERASKLPPEATLRPLEAPRIEEPIPTPTPKKESVLERFKKPSEEHPPGNVNWDRSQEWKSENDPSKSWDIQGELQNKT